MSFDKNSVRAKRFYGIWFSVKKNLESTLFLLVDQPLFIDLIVKLSKRF